MPPGSPRVVRPAMTTGEDWIGAFVGPDAEPSTAAARMQPLPWPADADAVTLPALPEARQVWVFIASRTGMMVKRPAVGAEGYVLSHYDRAALDRYLEQVGTRLLRPFGGAPPFAIFCDSLEVYESDWSPDFASEFARRRGYDPTPLLPRLASDPGLDGAALREDWGRTLTELLDERFITPLAAWARERGTRLRIQGYGIPPATVSSNARADLPEGEGHNWRELTATRWASSAGHLFDKPVVSSETWTWLHSPAFRATPLDVKAEADRHFLQGITQLIGHGWPSTPEGEDDPGWRFYAAGVFNDRNPWWIAMPDISRYLQRVSAALREGRPGNDVALYLPVHDAYAHASLGKMHLLDLVRERLGAGIVGSILDAGYGFDGVDDEALVRHAQIESGAMRIGAGRYRAVVVPQVEAMPAETLDVLARFAESGGLVIATGRAPSRPPGRQSADARSTFATRAAALFGGSGRASVAADSGAALRRALHAGVRPPIAIRSAGTPAADDTSIAPGIGVIERRLGDASLFYIVNTTNASQELQVEIDAPRRVVEWWDPLTAAVVRESADARGHVAMSLAPFESRFLLRTTETGAAGRPRASRPASSRPVGPWTVAAAGETWTLPAQAMAGWESRGTTRFHSGVATYDTTVTVTAADLKRRVWLDFGEGTAVAETPRRLGFRAWFDGPVREAAVVDVNGTRVGSVWCPPYRLDVTRALVAGPNRIRVRVGNTAMNQMAGRALPNYRLLNLRYGERFVPQDMDAVAELPSGLTATVKVVVEP